MKPYEAQRACSCAREKFWYPLGRDCGVMAILFLTDPIPFDDELSPLPSSGPAKLLEFFPLLPVLEEEATAAMISALLVLSLRSTSQPFSAAKLRI